MSPLGAAAGLLPTPWRRVRVRTQGAFSAHPLGPPGHKGPKAFQALLSEPSGKGCREGCLWPRLPPAGLSAHRPVSGSLGHPTEGPRGSCRRMSWVLSLGVSWVGGRDGAVGSMGRTNRLDFPTTPLRASLYPLAGVLGPRVLEFRVELGRQSGVPGWRSAQRHSLAHAPRHWAVPFQAPR